VNGTGEGDLSTRAASPIQQFSYASKLFWREHSESSRYYGAILARKTAFTAITLGAQLLPRGPQHAGDNQAHTDRFSTRRFECLPGVRDVRCSFSRTDWWMAVSEEHDHARRRRDLCKIAHVHACDRVGYRG